ncbi:MAG: Na+/H+ antiporter NhaA [Ilumatobacteraceae bacterium]
MPVGRHPSSVVPDTFLHRGSALARLARPIAQFLRIEASGGILLVAATLAALVWANSPWSAAYDQLWSTPVNVVVGSFRFEEDLLHVVNDGLMALFFFVVGLEIKRELVVGELRDRRNLALPAMAALGGMAVPAAIYTVVNLGGPGSRGWGIPMATDIAFALGVVALLGSRVPSPLKVFLLTLAIVDDLGAILVIAVFYSSGIELTPLLIAGGIVVAVVVLRSLRVASAPLYVIAGLALWLTVHESGVHATIAGVVMGLLTPARPQQSELEASAVVDALEDRRELSVEEVRTTASAIRRSVSPCERFVETLHPWTSYLIVPVFALANAGITLSGDSVSGAPRVMVGVVLGLVVGKVVGITGFAWVTTRLGLGALPDGVTWRQMFGVAALAGIGFTVSLFVTALAFEDDDVLGEAARIGILVASAVAAVAGALVFVVGRPRPSPPSRE